MSANLPLRKLASISGSIPRRQVTRCSKIPVFSRRRQVSAEGDRLLRGCMSHFLTGCLVDDKRADHDRSRNLAASQKIAVR
jgi:hypothetical protein